MRAGRRAVDAGTETRLFVSGRAPVVAPTHLTSDACLQVSLSVVRRLMMNHATASNCDDGTAYDKLLRRKLLHCFVRSYVTCFVIEVATPYAPPL